MADDDRADFELELEAIELTDFAAEDHEHAVDAELIDTELQQFFTTDEGLDAFNRAKGAHMDNLVEAPVKTDATPTTLDGYFHAVYASPHYAYGSGSWRLGQTFFNVLYEVRPDLAGEVRGNWNDPFYDDARLPLFLAHVTERWDNSTTEEGSDAAS